MSKNREQQAQEDKKYEIILQEIKDCRASELNDKLRAGEYGLEDIIHAMRRANKLKFNHE